MPLPGGITTCTLTGTYLSPDGGTLGGCVSFAPSSVLTDQAGQVIITLAPVIARLQAGTGMFSIPLACTDNADLLPYGWMWRAVISVPGAAGDFWFLLPSDLGATTDISSLAPAGEAPAPSSTFVSSVNGMTGAVTVTGGGISPPAGDIGGTGITPQVIATHLASPLPVAQGGTGATSGTAALTALGGAASSALTAETSRAETAEAAALQKFANLSDLGSATTARVNIGLSTAGGDLSGTLPSPTVARVNGVAVTGTPSAGQVLTATGSAAADWQASGATASTPGIYSILTYGATAAKFVSDGAMTASSATLACTTSAPFGAGSSLDGQIVVVVGAGSAGANLITTISAVTDSGHVTLAASASTTVTSAAVTFGPDSTSDIQSAVNAMLALGGGALHVPPGTFLTSSPVTGTNVGTGVMIYGDGNGSIIEGTGSYSVLDMTTGTGLTIRDMQILSAVTVPTAGASIQVNSIADYRLDRVSGYGSYYGVYTTGGTSKSAYSNECYFDAYFAGFYAEGSFALISSRFGGGSYGAILNSSGGHSQRMVRVGLYGPLSLTTWNTGLGANPNKTVWLTDVECNYQSGTNPPEGAGGMNLANCAGDVHITSCWLAGSGTIIGGGPGATGGRTDAGCTTTAGSATVLDASVVGGDAGSAVIGFGIPPGTTISSVGSGSFVMSAAALYSFSASLTVNVGGTSSPNAPTWVDIVGGVYSGNTLTYQNGINLAAGTEITVTGAHLTGSASHTSYDDINIASAVTGPVAITGCEFSGSSRYNITSAVTSGPVSIVGNAFTGFSGTSGNVVPVNITGTLSQHTIINGGYPSNIPSSLTVAQVGSNLTGGGMISQGSGAPSKPNGNNPAAGDMYFRTDTPSTANQRIYCCTTGGSSPVWAGIA